MIEEKIVKNGPVSEMIRYLLIILISTSITAIDN